MKFPPCHLLPESGQAAVHQNSWNSNCHADCLHVPIRGIAHAIEISIARNTCIIPHFLSPEGSHDLQLFQEIARHALLASQFLRIGLPNGVKMRRPEETVISIWRKMVSMRYGSRACPRWCQQPPPSASGQSCDFHSCEIRSLPEVCSVGDPHPYRVVARPRHNCIRLRRCMVRVC